MITFNTLNINHDTLEAYSPATWCSTGRVCCRGNRSYLQLPPTAVRLSQDNCSRRYL
ncbi:MAG: hypothetical protein PVH61_41985 [Candidatus Aminicenantes bacterium]